MSRPDDTGEIIASPPDPSETTDPTVAFERAQRSVSRVRSFDPGRTLPTVVDPVRQAQRRAAEERTASLEFKLDELAYGTQMHLVVTASHGRRLRWAVALATLASVFGLAAFALGGFAAAGVVVALGLLR